jgi:hypothetical protein
MLMVRRVLVECAQVKPPGYQYRLDAFLALFSLASLIVIMEELIEKRAIVVHE